MIYTGIGLRVRICAIPTHYHHWMAFACYSSVRRYLPDAEIELVVFGRQSLFFNWAKTLHLKTVRGIDQPAPIFDANGSGVLALSPECIAVRQWDNDKFVIDSFVNRSGTCCLKWQKDCEITELLCADAKLDLYTPFADVSKGVGAFVSSDWIHRGACFLSHIDSFVTGNETQTERAVFDEWHRAISLAACLGLNRT